MLATPSRLEPYEVWNGSQDDAHKNDSEVAVQEVGVTHEGDPTKRRDHRSLLASVQEVAQSDGAEQDTPK